MRIVANNRRVQTEAPILREINVLRSAVVYVSGLSEFLEETRALYGTYRRNNCAGWRMYTLLP
jgi:hypothetical protein